MVLYVIEDELHAEFQGEYSTIERAFAELKRRAEIPWDEIPNRAPCKSWRKCGRSYELIEYDDSQTPYREVRRLLALEISETGIKWDKSLLPPD